MQRINTYLTQKQDSALQQLAVDQGKTKADIIREAIDAFTDNANKELETFLSDFQSGFKTNRISLTEFGKLCKPTLHPFQLKLLEKMERYNRLVITKARQTGTTMLLCMHAIVMCSKPKTTVVFGVVREANAVLIRDRIHDLCKFHPSLKISSTTRSAVYFENGSMINISSMASKSFIEDMGKFPYIIDEFAFLPNGKLEPVTDKVIEILKQPHSKMCVASTPNGMHYMDDEYNIHPTPFFRLWEFAKHSSTPARAVMVKWWAVPGRDQEWRDAMNGPMGEDRCAAEFDCLFVDSNEKTIIDDIGVEG